LGIQKKHGALFGEGVYFAEKAKATFPYLNRELPDKQVILIARFKKKLAKRITYMVISSDIWPWTGWARNPRVDAIKVIRTDSTIWVVKDPNMLEIIGMHFTSKNQFSVNANNINSTRHRTGRLTIYKRRYYLRSTSNNLRRDVTLIKR
jgi:hypothetical protein